ASNKIKNSEIMLNSIIENKKAKITSQNNKELSGSNKKIKNVAEEIVSKNVQAIDAEPVNPENISGKWEGKIIEFDWSGTHIRRVFPVTVEFTHSNEGIDYIWMFNGREDKDFGIWMDETLYFENLSIKLEVPYVEYF